MCLGGHTLSDKSHIRHRAKGAHRPQNVDTKNKEQINVTKYLEDPIKLYVDTFWFY